jgi:hypothetical protein
MINDGTYNIAGQIIEAANAISDKFAGMATGGGCDYIVRFINPDKDMAERKVQFLPSPVLVMGSAIDAGTPDDLTEASRVTLYLDQDDWSGCQSITFEFKNAIEALRWMGSYDTSHYEPNGNTALEMALALGFDSVERMHEHQTWLEEHGSKEFQSWLATIRQHSQEAKRGFKVGDLVRFVRQVDRFPHFSVPVGATGVLVEYTRGSLIGEAEHKVGGCAHVRVHATLSGGEEWDNCVEWIDDLETFEDFHKDVELWKHEPSRICGCPRCAYAQREVDTHTVFAWVRCIGDGSYLYHFKDNGVAVFTKNKSEAQRWRTNNKALKNLIGFGHGVYQFEDDEGKKIEPKFN